MSRWTFRATFMMSVALLTVLFAASHCDAVFSKSPFVQRDGTRFILGGETFTPVGVNNHYLTFGSHKEVLRVLDAAVRIEANVIRTFLQPVIGVPGDSSTNVWDFDKDWETSNLGVNGHYMLYWDRARNRMAFNDGPKGLGKFDILVYEAKKRNLRLIVTFLDFWAYTGGAQQMRGWYGSTSEEEKYNFFFSDPRTRADFKRWMKHVLNRVNPLTGVAYKDEPAIFAFELMNEPYAKPESLYISWVTEMAEYFKSINKNHLIATGHAGVSNAMSELSISAIDFGTWHGYPLYYDLTNDEFADLIDQSCALGHQHDKPVLLEEFGLARKHADQAIVYHKWLKRLEDNPDCAGWLIWRLVGRQDSGKWPVDENDQFDLRDESDDNWFVVRCMARRLKKVRMDSSLKLDPKCAALEQSHPIN